MMRIETRTLATKISLCRKVVIAKRRNSTRYSINMTVVIHKPLIHKEKTIFVESNHKMLQHFRFLKHFRAQFSPLIFTDTMRLMHVTFERIIGIVFCLASLALRHE